MDLHGRQQLLLGATECGLHLSEHQLDQFSKFLDRLYEVNLSLNLTRIPIENAVSLHLLDSLLIARATTLSDGQHLIDIGTGAGFPGVPLAIAMPGVHFTLVDATAKRLKFIADSADALGINNITLVHGRAEDLAKTGMRNSANVVTARAVARLDKLATWMLPFACDGGVAIAYKSEDAEEEIRKAMTVIEKYGASAVHVVQVAIPGDAIRRRLVVMTKPLKPHNLRSLR